MPVVFFYFKPRTVTAIGTHQPIMLALAFSNSVAKMCGLCDHYYTTELATVL